MGWARLLRPRPAQELALQEAWAGVSVTRSLSWGWRCMMCELELAQVSWRLENTYKNIGVWRIPTRTLAFGEYLQEHWRLENTHKNIGVWRSKDRQDGHMSDKVSPHSGWQARWA